ncbi:MAG: hypothetical protein ACRD32_00275, partial [Nitrososphaerales archaeon]
MSPSVQQVVITMKNEITRKLTSLTLLTILLASGVTFAVPGSLPAAEAAHNANLFVSAESSIFKNTFGGPMVVEIVINDPALTDTDEAKGEPDVTINGKDVRMVQGSDGLWYAYVADRLQAQTADNIAALGINGLLGTDDPGQGLDFGVFCGTGTDISDVGPGTIILTDTVGIALPNEGGGADDTAGTNNGLQTAVSAAFPDCTPTGVGVRTNNVVREQHNPSSTAGTNPLGQIDLGSGIWPFIQLYKFNPTGSVEIKYNKGGGTQTTTLTFDTLDTYSKISLDKSTYTTGSEVHAVLTDGQLNIDPTDEDSWTFGTAAPFATHYQLFTENGAIAGDITPGGSPNIAPNLSSLMFEDNGIVKLNPGAPAIVDLDANNDQTLFVDSTVALTSTVQLPAGTQPMTFVETGANTGSLTNYDENDDSNLDVLAGAARGTSASIDYNKKATSIVVGFGFGTLSFATPTGGVWNSGEEIAVTLVDSDANKNSRADEDLDVFNPLVTLIPSLSIGDPFTLGETADGATGIDSLFNDDVGGDITNTEDVQKFSKRAVLTTSTFIPSVPTPVEPILATHLIVDLKTDMADLLNTARLLTPPTPPVDITVPGFNGFNLINLDLRSLTTQPITFTVKLLSAADGCPIISTGPYFNGFNDDDEDNDGLINEDPTAGDDPGGLAAPDDDGDGPVGEDAPAACVVTVDPSTIVIGANELSLTDVSGTIPYGIAPTREIGLEIEFSAPIAITSSLTTVGPYPIVTDFFSFGLVNEGLKTDERINNSIYRFELEESGDNTSTFIGTAEYTLLNQINIFSAATYTNLRPIDDEVTFIVHDDLDDEDAPRINYLDLGADGVSTQIADQKDAATHSATVSFDKDSYKVADTVTVTVNDADINVDSDLIDIFVTVAPIVAGISDPAAETVGVALGATAVYLDTNPFGRLLDITFDDERWIESDADGNGIAPFADCVDLEIANGPAFDDGLNDSGFTLIETGTDSGVFKGDFQIPSLYCSRAAIAAGLPPVVSTTGTDIEVNYVDFRDGSGEVIEVGDGAGVRANTGSVSFDRTVYPVPFGAFVDYLATPVSPTTQSLFPTHLTAITTTGAGLVAGETLPQGTLNVHIRVNDPDFDISAAGEDVIAALEPTNGPGNGPLLVSVTRGSARVDLATAGAP